ncbi:hypothetical protein Pla52n_68850 [Stieleria varia]|uniref:Uncharacterized protein n=1 Tax=Stieleria varia TaxID=2528005 RepID=A0A5C5ZR26_9BACT|nr:hypothetical protein Pla52n_68850 [Stieleria varia]
MIGRVISYRSRHGRIDAIDDRHEMEVSTGQVGPETVHIARLTEHGSERVHVGRAEQELNRVFRDSTCWRIDVCSIDDSEVGKLFEFDRSARVERHQTRVCQIDITDISSIWRTWRQHVRCHCPGRFIQSPVGHRRISQHSIVIRIRSNRQDFRRQHTVHISGQNRSVTHTVDCDRQRRRVREILIGHRVGERFDESVTCCQSLHVRVRVVQCVRVAAVRVPHQRSVLSGTGIEGGH